MLRSLFLLHLSVSKPSPSPLLPIQRSFMASHRTQEGHPRGRGRGSSHGRGSVSADKSLSSLDDSPPKVSKDYTNKTPQIQQSFRPQQSKAFPERARGGSNIGGPERDLKSSVYRNDDLPKFSDSDKKTLQPIKPQHQQTSPEKSRMPSTNVKGSAGDLEVHPFDIFRSETGGRVKLNKSILELNRERRKEIEQSKHVPQYDYLRPGMVLLKGYISLHDQVRIAERCRELGLGSGGFDRPGYRDGSKLHLQMMCLGKIWDPETRQLTDKRSDDGVPALKIPQEFINLVDSAIRTSHEFLQKNNRGIIVEDELPRMSPDICVVNFYNHSGRLGLHQDKDESKESLEKGLPVVSFSIGNSAEFIYGEQRDVNTAKKVVLESGDVLIFGGKSRLLFHGVPSIIPNSAPKRLIDETKLKPGRLNLTFRQY